MTGVFAGIVTVVVTEFVIGVGTELVTGVGVETPYIVFSLLGGYPHCSSSFLNWLRSPSHLFFRRLMFFLFLFMLDWK